MVPELERLTRRKLGQRSPPISREGFGTREGGKGIAGSGFPRHYGGVVGGSSQRHPASVRLQLRDGSPKRGTGLPLALRVQRAADDDQEQPVETSRHADRWSLVGHRQQHTPVRRYQAVSGNTDALSEQFQSPLALSPTPSRLVALYRSANWRKPC